MAAYNGEAYIKEQIDSILKQLKYDDELIISYNASTDNTFKILEDYASKDDRVAVIKCQEKGVIPNFENAIANCKNELIFLSDQDDVWNDRKVKIMSDIFNDKAVGCVIHSCDLVDADLNVIQHSKNDRIKRLSPFGIILKNRDNRLILSCKRKGNSLP